MTVLLFPLTIVTLAVTGIVKIWSKLTLTELFRLLTISCVILCRLKTGGATTWIVRIAVEIISLPWAGEYVAVYVNVYVLARVLFQHELCVLQLK